MHSLEVVREVRDALAASLNSMDELEATLKDTTEPFSLEVSQSYSREEIFVNITYSDEIVAQMVVELIDKLIVQPEMMDLLFIQGKHYYVIGGVMLSSIYWGSSQCVDLLDYDWFLDEWANAEERVNNDLIKDGVRQAPEEA